MIGITSMICFHTVFFMQGVLQNCFQEELSHDYNIIKRTHWYPILFTSMMFIYGMGWASSELN